MSPEVNAPPTTMMSAAAVVANHLPAALTVPLNVVVRPAPNILIPATAEPFTVSVPPLPNVRSPLTALISPHAAPAVAAKVTGALIVTSPVLWFSTFACTPLLSKSEITAPPELFSVHALAPVQSSWFMLMLASTMFVVRVLPAKVSVP